MNESNSDFFGELIEARALDRLGRQPDADVHDGWTIANNTVRTMCDPAHDGEGPGRVIWTPDLDLPSVNVDAHEAAGPLNRVKCFLARGMLPIGSPSSPELQSPFVRNGFPALGTTLAAMLQYQSLPYLGKYLVPRSFANVRQAMLDTAVAGFGGKYSPTYKAVEDSFAAILVGAAADRVPPTVTSTSGTTITKTRGLRSCFSPASVSARDCPGTSAGL